MRLFICLLVLMMSSGCNYEQSPVPCLMAFTATWCQPCQRDKPLLAEVAQEFPVREIDIDSQPEIAAQYQVISVPTYVITMEGMEVQRTSTESTRSRMRFTVPSTDHPIVRVIAKVGAWSNRWHMNRSRRECEVVIPAGIDLADVEVLTEFCDEAGKVLEPGPVLKKATPKPKPKAPIPVEPRKPERFKKWRDRQPVVTVPPVPDLQMDIADGNAGSVA